MSKEDLILKIIGDGFKVVEEYKISNDCVYYKLEAIQSNQQSIVFRTERVIPLDLAPLLKVGMDVNLHQLSVERLEELCYQIKKRQRYEEFN